MAARRPTGGHPEPVHIGPEQTRAWAEGDTTGRSWPGSVLSGCDIDATIDADGPLLWARVTGADRDVPGDELNALLRDIVPGRDRAMDVLVMRRLVLDVPNMVMTVGNRDRPDAADEMLDALETCRTFHGDELFVELLAAALETAVERAQLRNGVAVERKTRRIPSKARRKQEPHVR